jgi:hypothetical protein
VKVCVKTNFAPAPSDRLRLVDLDITGELGATPVSTVVASMGGSQRDAAGEAVALAERLATWMGGVSRDELRGFLPELVRLSHGDVEQESRKCLAAADWFMRSFAPEMLRRIGEIEYATILEGLPEVVGPAAIDRAVSVCSSMTYLVDGPAEQVFHLAVDALELLADDPFVVGVTASTGIRSLPGSFGRRLADAVVVAAVAIYGDDPSGDDDPAGGGPDVFASIDWEGLLQVMVAA